MTNQVLTAGPIGMIYILKWFRPDVDNGMDFLLEKIPVRVTKDRIKQRNELFDLTILCVILTETVQSWEDILISAGIIHIVLIFFLLFGRKSEDGNV